MAARRTSTPRASAWLPLLAMALGAGTGCTCRGDATPAPAPTTSAPAQDDPPSGLPPSERVFVIADGAGADLVLGGSGASLWLARPEGPGYRILWQEAHQGELQLAAAGDFGRGRRLYIACGAGRRIRSAPLVLEEVELETGRSSELWRRSGERNEAAHLSIGDVDGDGAPELAFAYFASTHEVRARHLEADGRALEGEPIRMATTRAFADVDGDGRADEIVGRLYGDARDAPGDLRVRLGDAWRGVPVDGGVRAIAVSRVGAARTEIYFADGWDADYGRRARAQLKRAVWSGAGFEVELVGRLPDEFTVFDVTPFDFRGDGAAALLARGSARATLLERPAASDGWRARAVAELDPSDTTALGRDAAGRWVLYVSGAGGTRAVSIPITP